MKAVDYFKIILSTIGIAFLNYISQSILSLKLIGGPQEPLLSKTAPGLIIAANWVSFMLTRGIKKLLVRKIVVKSVTVAGITLLLSLAIGTFVDGIALDQFPDRLLWYFRFVLIILLFLSIGTIIGALWNVSKNS